MAMTIHVDIVSAEESIFSGRAEMVFAPAQMGEVGIAPQHTPLLSPLKAGAVRVKIDENTEKDYFISGGILEVQPSVVTILADTATRAKDLDEAKAKEMKKKAEKKLKDHDSVTDMAAAQAELIESLAQLELIAKLRNRR